MRLSQLLHLERKNSQHSSKRYSKPEKRVRTYTVESLEKRYVLTAPVAVEDLFTAFGGGELSVGPEVGVLANDTDAEGDPLSAELVTGTSNGFLTFNEDGSFNYTPNAGFFGSDTFTYKTKSNASQATVPLTVSSGSATVNVTLDVPSIGSDSDSDTSALTGTGTVIISPNSSPFDELQITELDLVVAENIDLNFCLASLFGFCVAGVDVSATGGDITASLETPGPAAAVVNDGFAQNGNIFFFAGTVSASGTGAASGQIPEGPQAFGQTVDTPIPLVGSVQQVGQLITITTNIAVAQNGLVLSDDPLATADFSLNGNITLTGTLPGIEESNTVTVTINVPARDDLYTLNEDSSITTSSSPSQTTDVIIPSGSLWSYLDDGTDQGTAWREPAFNPNDPNGDTNLSDAWDVGAGVLGYDTNLVEQDDEVDTILDFGGDTANKFTTTYFRRDFAIEDVSDISELQISLFRDDAAAVYINGIEVLRDNLAPGAAFDDFALLTQDGTQLFNIDLDSLPPEVLVNGLNSISVEVHQASLTSSDIRFDLGLSVVREDRSVLANDKESGLVANLVTGVTDGTLTGFGSDGTFTYTPDANFNGTDSFSYIAHDPTVSTLLVAPNSVWRFLDDGSDQGTDWKASAFDSSTWDSGPAQLGYGDDDINTVVSFGNNAADKHVTTYFIHHFDVPDASIYAGQTLTLNVLRDDGVAVYLNGDEVGRDNLVAAAASGVLADNTIGGAGETTPVEFSISGDDLVNGDNVLAVEIHQATPGSSDLSMDAWLSSGPISQIIDVDFVVAATEDLPTATDFDFEVTFGSTLTVDDVIGLISTAADIDNNPLVVFDPSSITAASGTLVVDADGSFEYTPTATGSDSFTYRASQSPKTVIPLNSTWRYLDNGTSQDGNGTADPGDATWFASSNFDDSGWISGVGQFGYGDNEEADVISTTTTVRYGPNPAAKHITTYFRHEFNLEDASSVAAAAGLFFRDDGVVIYLNGVEIRRSNMGVANSPVNSSTLAPANGTDDGDTTHVLLPNSTAEALFLSLLVDGTNVITAEIHQNGPTSSDITFDLSLDLSFASQSQTVNITINPPPLTGDLDGDNLVGLKDLLIMKQAFSTNNPIADLDGSTVVDAADLAILLSNYGKTVSSAPPAAAAASLMVSVPAIVTTQVESTTDESSPLKTTFIVAQETTAEVSQSRSATRRSSRTIAVDTVIHSLSDGLQRAGHRQQSAARAHRGHRADARQVSEALITALVADSLLGE